MDQLFPIELGFSFLKVLLSVVTIWYEVLKIINDYGTDGGLGKV